MRRTKKATAAIAMILALLAGANVTRPTVLKLEAPAVAESTRS
jgi:hypothetical protein